MERMLTDTKRRRVLVPIPWAIARMMGRVGQHVPGTPLTLDQVRLLRFDTVVSEEAKHEGRTLKALGVEPTALEIVLPTYLTHYRERGEFTQVRAIP
jgi:NADH dehydrogenase